MDKQKARIHAEKAIREEVTKVGLSYIELSPLMRELLAKMYLRGGHEVLNSIKENSHLTENL